MSATVTRVPSVLSIHQLDDETMNDPKCSTVQKTCAPGQRLPTLSYAPKRAAIKAMKKVRSFGSFDDLKVPDLNDLVSEFGDGSSDVQRNNTNSERTSDDGSLSDGDTGSTGGGYVQVRVGAFPNPGTHCFISNAGDCSDRLPYCSDQLP
jgi:hypothetical protein